MQSMRSYSLRKVLQNGYRRSSSLIGRDSLIRIPDCPFQLDVISEQFVSRANDFAPLRPTNTHRSNASRLTYLKYQTPAQEWDGGYIYIQSRKRILNVFKIQFLQ